MNNNHKQELSEAQVENTTRRRFLLATLIAAFLTTISANYASAMSWYTVVNNTYEVPGEPDKHFFSYNQPSINDDGVVVFRARAKAASGEGTGSGSGSGSGGALHGIFTKDVTTNGAPILSLAVGQSTLVPEPDNLGSTFTEFPAFPRIDAQTDTVAFRGQSMPVYEYATGTDPITGEPVTTRAGTSGVYTNPNNGPLVTGASQLGLAPGLSQYQVPEASDVSAGTKFDQFPGAPSPDGNLVAFKGNFTNNDGVGQTGVYYRDVVANGGTSSVVQIARSDMDIPTEAIPAGYTGTGTFGSTAPPSAADGKMVFVGLDVEAAPKAGGIFMADMVPDSSLKTVVSFNTSVPNHGTETFSALGEGLSFDGRYIGFWGGWGTETFTKTVSCSGDGNSAILGACISQDNNGIAGDGIYEFEVLKNQGIFLADTVEDTVTMVAETGTDFSDFLFWNFSGKPPGTGTSEEGDDAEPPRWRSSAFVAIDGDSTVFKALNISDESGLYAGFDINDPKYSSLVTLLETGMGGGLVDPDAVGLPITALGIERDGFRNDRIAINVSMSDGINSQAGIYVSTPELISQARSQAVATPEPGTFILLGLGLFSLAGLRRRRKK